MKTIYNFNKKLFLTLGSSRQDVSTISRSRFGHIHELGILRLSAVASAIGLMAIIAMTLSPVTQNPNYAIAATGTATASETVLTLSSTQTIASLDIATKSSNGTFSSSTATGNAAFDIVSNNATGYTLGINASDDAGTLISEDGDVLGSIGSVSVTGITADTFDNPAYDGKWGFRPSKYVSDNAVIDNSSESTGVFLPAPTTDSTTLDITDTANSAANHYTIGLGARVNYDTPTGVYANTFVLTTIGNPVSYSITYNKGNTTDTVGNLPATQASSTSETSIILSSSVPTRDHYSFSGWCMGAVSTTNGIDTCTGADAKTFAAGDTFGIDQTTTNDTTLYAMWEVEAFTQTTRVRYEDANGGWSDYTTVDTQDVGYGSSYSWSTSQIADFDSSTYQSAGVASYTVDSAKTNDVSIYRNTHTLTVSAGSNTSSASGSGTYRVGQTVTVSVSKNSNTSCTTYNTPTWSKNSGATGTFSSASGTSVSYTIGTTNDTVTATSSASNNTFAITIYASGGASGVYLGGTYYSNGSTTHKTCGSYSIYGSYNSGYEFSYWSYSGNSVSSTSSSSTTYTVSGSGTLYLYGKSSCASSISGTMQNFDPSNLCSDVTSGTLTDSRDNQTYTVAKINGNWWMTRNLAIGCNGSGSTYGSSVSSKSLTSSDSDVNSSWSTPTALLSTSANSSATSGYDTAAIECNATYGGYYNYAAATAGTISGSSNSNTQHYGICPKGWRLPTISEFSGITSYTSAFSPVYSGYYYSGTLRDTGSYGNWWSTNIDGGTRRRYLFYNSGSLNTTSNYRYYGYSVRCIRSS